MTYKLVFKEEALREWGKLDGGIREQFKKKLKECLVSPIIEPNKLSGMKNDYKIKLRSSGFRLVYEVRNKELIVAVVAVGKRERNSVYNAAVKRI
jgi:mRNA interferase RelE/StbE